MKKIYHRLAALSLAAMALSSCSRSTYSFNPHTPAYLGVQPTATAPAPRTVAPATVAVAPTAAPAEVAVAPTVAAPVVAPVAPHVVASSANPAQPTAVAKATDPTVATLSQTKTTKPTLVQRLALKKVMKQVAKAESRQQNTAGVAHTAAKGAPLTVAIVGLIALLVGIIASSGLVIVLGAIVLVVGLILLLLSGL